MSSLKNNLRTFAVPTLLAAGAAMTFLACGVDPNQDEEPTATLDNELTSSTTKGNWSKFPDGEECLAAVQGFYPAKFGVSLPVAGPGSDGNCAAYGACKLWLDKRPSSSEWERVDNDGNHLPTTYDLIVYPPSSGDPWGHIASVDHVEGKTIYVMDDNYVAHHKKAAHPHTVSVKAYGWYHLKKLGGSPPPVPQNSSCVDGGFYCGGDKVSGNANTLYECVNGGPHTVRACTHGCEVRSGKDDACRCEPDSFYCGGDLVEGSSSTLYRCGSDGVSVTVEQHCSKGCAVHPGNDDACK